MGAKYVCKHGVFNQWCKLCADKYPSGQPRNPVNDLKEAEGMNLLYKHDSEDQYWLRRWAGDAMKGLLSSSQVGISYEHFAEHSLKQAEALLKAFKEKEKENE